MNSESCNTYNLYTKDITSDIFNSYPNLFNLSFLDDNLINSSTKDNFDDEIFKPFTTFSEEKEKKDPAEMTFKTIQDILINHIPNFSNIIHNSFVYDNNTRKFSNIAKGDLIRKKRRRKKNFFTENYIESKKLGRKKQDDISNRRHNKNSPDNIIKKVKSYLLSNALIFLNNIINNNIDKNKKLDYYNSIRISDSKTKDYNNLLKPFDYRFIDSMKRESELSLFNKSLKDLFSENISPKFKNFRRESNKIIINKIIKEERKNDIVMFAFNLTFREWLDIFLYKKELKSAKNFDTEKMGALINNFNYFNTLLEEICSKNNDKNYLSSFIFLIYNYERWFYVKKSRKRKTRSKSKE
jgi:hypothetical protein